MIGADWLSDLEGRVSPALLLVAALLVLVLFVRDIPSRLFERRTRQALEQLRRAMADLAGAQSAIVERQTDLGGSASVGSAASNAGDSRRFAAEQALWQAVVSFDPVKRLGRAAYQHRLELLIDAAHRSPEAAVEAQRFAVELLRGQGLESADALPWRMLGETARPFVPAMLWAHFACYRAVLLHALRRVAAACTNGDKHPAPPLALTAALGTLLPDLKTAVERSGATGFPLLYDMLEQRIRALLTGAEAEDAALAATVISLLDAHDRAGDSEQLPGSVAAKPDP